MRVSLQSKAPYIYVLFNILELDSKSEDEEDSKESDGLKFLKEKNIENSILEHLKLSTHESAIIQRRKMSQDGMTPEKGNQTQCSL